MDATIGKTENATPTAPVNSTASLALLAGTPGLLLTAYAAASSTSLTIRADLALTVLDMLVMLTTWLLTRGKHRTAPKRLPSQGETLATGMAALCMSLSMAVVGGFAIQRIAIGGVEPQGHGIAVGLALNAGYAAVNFWILRRWKARVRIAPSALVRAQVSLFCDKLSSNILIAAALGSSVLLEGTIVAGFIDPVAGLLIAVMSGRWAMPVAMETIRNIRAGLSRRARRQSRTFARGAR